MCVCVHVVSQLDKGYDMCISFTLLTWFIKWFSSPLCLAAAPVLMQIIHNLLHQDSN